MSPRPTTLGAALTVVGAALCAWGLLSAPRPSWALALGLATLIAWLARTVLVFLPLPRAADSARVAAVVAVAAGSLAATSTGANALIPAAVCTMVLVADEAVPFVGAAVLAGGGLLLTAVGAVLSPTSVPALAGMLAGVLVGALAGLSRRQSTRARRRDALLAERERALREEAGRNALARDLHDVLAHSLGGLVVQLDAAEALLEAGDTSSARERVAAARELAAAGLGEARRAVGALRRPPDLPDEDAAAASRVAPDELDHALADLVAMHRALGGEIAWERTGDPAPLDRAQAATLQRALQEALSNARRHAAGRPVEAALEWRPRAVRLTVANPVAEADASASGGVALSGGFGLQGMRERVDALPLGGTVTVTRTAGTFVLTIEEVLR